VNRHNVYFGSGDDAIDLDNMTRPLLIERNRIMYAGQDGIEIRLQDASAPAQLIEIIIGDNVIVGSAQDGIQIIDYTGAPADTNRRFVITGNLIADCARAGIGLMPDERTNEDYSGAAVAEAIRISNNTFYRNDYGISGGGNLVAFNNIIAGSRTRGVWRVQGGNGVVAYTLFANNGTDAAQSTLGAGVVFGQDPRFASAPNPGPDGAQRTADDDFGGLTLQAGSPAVDAGTAQYTAASGEAIPPAPIAGFSGAAPDLGWREFDVSPPAETGTPTATRTSTPAPTSTPTSTPAPPDVIFADGFESGDLSAWSSSVTDGGDLSASAAAALAGAYSMRAVIDDNVPIYVTDERPAAEARYRARFSFDPNSIAMAKGDSHAILHGLTASSTPVLRVELRFSGSTYQVRAGLRDDGGTWRNSGWFAIGAAPHTIEVAWRASTGAGANSGGLTLWIDGAQRADLTGVDNDTRRIERARLGAVAGIDSGTRGAYSFDTFESQLQ
ncbi:MAG TPA: right-handed parallel beta-helix repeat-containing protein, partial [Roseiflexaceae bacterium]|nr:right-handed parallel beta-helix repeat-containing protein [Roseiflexaceae bacterium]